MDMDSFVAAMETILLNVSKLPPAEVLANFPQVHKIFVRMSSMLVDMELYDSALKFQEHFLKMCEQYDVGDAHPNVYSYAINDVAETYSKMGKMSLAKRYYEQNIKFNERVKRSGGANVSTLLDLQLAYGKLALIQATADPSKVLTSSPAVTKLLQLQQGVITQLAERSDCKPTKKVIATVSAVNTLLEMAHLCMKGGEMEGGLEFFDKARVIAKQFEALDEEMRSAPSSSSLYSTSSNSDEQDLGDDDVPSLKDTLDSIELGRTSFLTRMGRHEEAFAEASTILKRQRARLSDDSPLLIATHNNLGHILASLSRFPEAEEQLWRAVELVLRHNGDEFLEVYGERLYHMQALLANVLKVQNKTHEATEVQESNAKLSPQVFGELSPQALESLYYLSTLMIDLKQYTHAFKAVADAYAKYRAGAIKITNPIALPLARTYATLLFGGNPTNAPVITAGSTRPAQAQPLNGVVPIDAHEAERVILEISNAVIAAYGAKSKEAASCAMTLGHVYEEAALNYEKAISKYRQALDALQSLPVTPQRETSVLSAQIAMARALCADRRLSEAKPYLDDALSASRSLAADATKRLKALPPKGVPAGQKEQINRQIALAIVAYSAASNWYQQANQLNKAVLSLEDGLVLGASSIGADHPQVLNLGLQLAHVLITSGQLSKASETLKTLSQTVADSKSLTPMQKKSTMDKINAKVSQAKQATTAAAQAPPASNMKPVRTRVASPN